MQNHPVASGVVSAPKNKDNTIAIIVSYVVLAVLMSYVIFGGEEPVKEVVVAPKVEKPKATVKPATAVKMGK